MRDGETERYRETRNVIDEKVERRIMRERNVVGSGELNRGRNQERARESCHLCRSALAVGSSEFRYEYSSCRQTAPGEQVSSTSQDNWGVLRAGEWAGHRSRVQRRCRTELNRSMSSVVRGSTVRYLTGR